MFFVVALLLTNRVHQNIHVEYSQLIALSKYRHFMIALTNRNGLLIPTRNMNGNRQEMQKLSPQSCVQLLTCELVGTFVACFDFYYHPCSCCLQIECFWNYHCAQDAFAKKLCSKKNSVLTILIWIMYLLGCYLLRHTESKIFSNLSHHLAK